MIDPLLLQLGVLTTAQLTALGWTKAARDSALARSVLERLRPGWYALPGANASVAAAVRAGGCLSCASALRARGAWVPASLGRGHVRRSRHHGDRTSRRGCAPRGRAPAMRAAVDDVDVAFRCLLRCGGPEELVVVADSLLHLGLATREELVRWSADAPMRVQALLARVDRAESGLESLVRLRLRARGIAVRTQVQLGAARVDLLVGDRLVIECDGAEHHGSWEAHAADRARDRALTAKGYLVVRLTYRQIVDDWPAVERDLLAIVRRGAHRWARRIST